jgi:hypothetical protein
MWYTVSNVKKNFEENDGGVKGLRVEESRERAQRCCAPATAAEMDDEVGMGIRFGGDSLVMGLAGARGGGDRRSRHG